jgi:hypothetical protein
VSDSTTGLDQRTEVLNFSLSYFGQSISIGIRTGGLFAALRGARGSVVSSSVTFQGLTETFPITPGITGTIDSRLISIGTTGEASGSGIISLGGVNLRSITASGFSDFEFRQLIFRESILLAPHSQAVEGLDNRMKSDVPEVGQRRNMLVII